MVFTSGGNSLADFSPRNFAVWMLLTFQAGVINVGGFLACGRLVTHTTGFATFFGAEMAHSKYGVALGMLVVPLFFLLGCMISSFFTDGRRLRGKNPRYDLLIFIIASALLTVAFLGGAGIFGRFGEGLSFNRDFVLLTILTLAAGIQNAAISSASGAQVRTTHLTGVTTDLGISLVRMFHWSLDSDHFKKEFRSNQVRLSLIGAFIFGSLLGAIMFLEIGYLGFLLPGLISGGLFAYSRLAKS